MTYEDEETGGSFYIRCDLKGPPRDLPEIYNKCAERERGNVRSLSSLCRAWACMATPPRGFPYGSPAAALEAFHAYKRLPIAPVHPPSPPPIISTRSGSNKSRLFELRALVKTNSNCFHISRFFLREALLLVFTSVFKAWVMPEKTWARDITQRGGGIPPSFELGPHVRTAHTLCTVHAEAFCIFSFYYFLPLIDFRVPLRLKNSKAGLSGQRGAHSNMQKTRQFYEKSKDLFMTAGGILLFQGEEAEGICINQNHGSPFPSLWWRLQAMLFISRIACFPLCVFLRQEAPDPQKRLTSIKSAGAS